MTETKGKEKEIETIDTVEQIKNIIKDCIEKKGQFVVNAGCGLGKSTAVSQLLRESKQGILFLTDTIDGIKNVVKDNKDVYIFTSATHDKQKVADGDMDEKDVKRFTQKLWRVRRHKHVAMTTQLFNLLSIESKKAMYENRIIIVDEEIEFSKFIKIDDSYTADLLSLFAEEPNKDKFEYTELRKLASIIDTDFKSYTSSLNKDKKEKTLMTVKRKKNTRINKTIKRAIKLSKSSELKSRLEHLYNLYNTVSIYKYIQGERIALYTSYNLLEHYKVPETTIILDGTAHLVMEYKQEDFEIIELDIDETENNNRIIFSFTDTNISITSFKRQDEKMLKAIEHLIRKNNPDLILSAKVINKHIEDNLYYDKNLVHFGKEKGSNFARFCTILQILGVPRQNEIEYLLKYFSLYPNELQKCGHGKDLSYLLETRNDYTYQNKTINAIMFSSLIRSLIQGIYRSNIRERQSKEKIHIHMAFNEQFYREVLDRLVKDEFKGSTLIKLDSDDFVVDTILSGIETRYSNTNIAKVIEFMETVEHEVDRKQIEEHTGLSNAQLKRVFFNDIMKEYINENFIEENTRPKKYIKLK